jgi:DnaK suppressor protein
MGLERDVLRAELARARAGLDDLEGEYAALADPENVALDDEHDSEGSTVGFERARVAGLVARSRRRVSDLEDATRRAEAGGYGYCSSCGSEIGTGRLAALPATRLCINCAHSGVLSD